MGTGSSCQNGKQQPIAGLEFVGYSRAPRRRTRYRCCERTPNNFLLHCAPFCHLTSAAKSSATANPLSPSLLCSSCFPRRTYTAATLRISAHQLRTSLHTFKMTDKEFTYSDVSEHTTKKDLYIVVHDKVYNASSFVDEHPYAASLSPQDVLCGIA